MKKQRILGIISLICCICAVLPSCAVLKKRYSETYLDYFDTVTSFTVYGVTEKKSDAANKLLKDELEKYHRLFDIYNTYNGIANIKTINDNAGISPVAVDKELIEFLEYSVYVYGFTSGYVNIAMGSVLSIWHSFREKAVNEPENAELPNIADLRKADLHTDINNIVINKEKSEVYIKDVKTSIDVGAVAKGYAAQRIADKLTDEGYGNFVLSLGGNIVTRGKKENRASWQAAIEDPTDTSKTLCSLSLTDKALVTSGSYQRYYTVNGERYHHIINPRTLMPENEYLSVSVICEDSALADVLSTALFNMPIEDGAKLVSETDGAEAMWVSTSGEKIYSEKFESYIVS